MAENICAIATPYGNGAIAIIRCSGSEAITLVNNLFQGKDLTKVKGNRIVYGHLVYDNEIIDEVMISVFRAPYSFDGENSCEINCHGGAFVTNKILKILLKSGFRMAEPGEFSKRAFLNHKMDLTSAESIMDIVNAENDLALKSSVNALKSSVRNMIGDFRNEILDLLAKVEVNIDYPEYDDAVEVTQGYLLPHLDKLILKAKEIIANSAISKIIIHGIKTAIVGRPNVGKSSLLNMLLDEDKAIVSNIPGTTRDVVEGHVNLGEVSLHLLDTAGIRNNADELESIGIEKSRQMINEADLIILVLSLEDGITKEDLELIDLVKNKPCVYVANKKDLSSDKLAIDKAIYISAKNKEGLLELKDRILEVTQIKGFDITANSLNNVRQITLMEEALTSLIQAKEGCLNNLDVFLIEIDLKNAFDKLGEITGEAYPEELITALFTKFCLGK